MDEDAAAECLVVVVVAAVVVVVAVVDMSVVMTVVTFRHASSAWVLLLPNRSGARSTPAREYGHVDRDTWAWRWAEAG